MRVETLLPWAAVVSALAAVPCSAQHLHTNDRWDECSIVLDASLTQDAWHQFVAEVGNVVSFRPMTDARPMGRGSFEVAVMQWGTRIDDRDAAWNDTFSHPDSTHWLFDGDALMIPGLMVRAGVSERIDAGVYFTKNPNANYGFYGGQLQYAFLVEDAAPVSASVRASLVHLFGPDDAKAGVYGLDLVASRSFPVLTDFTSVAPYAVVSGFLSRGQETTDAVALDDESVFGAQGTLGLAANVWALRLGAEYSVGRVDGYSFKIAFGF